MRLDILENGHSPLQKIVLTLVGGGSARNAPGPMLVMSYRRDLFGKYIAECFQEAMRQATAWTVAEVELFAAFVSNLNQCQY